MPSIATAATLLPQHRRYYHSDDASITATTPLQQRRRFYHSDGRRSSTVPQRRFYHAQQRRFVSLERQLASRLRTMNPEAATVLMERSSAVLDSLKYTMYNGDDRCYVPGEQGRRVECRCLRHLLEAQNTQTKTAVGLFLIGMKEREDDEAKIKTYDSSRRCPPNPTNALNNPPRQEYRLPLVFSKSKPSPSTPGIIVCRGAVMELLFLTLRWERNVIKKRIKPGQAAIGNERKKNLFAMLRYFLKEGMEIHSEVNWNVPELKQIGVPKGTKKFWANPKQFALREIVALHGIRRIDKHSAHIADTFGGRVCTIPSHVISDAFPLLRKKGSGGEFKTVHPNSVGMMKQFYSARVKYRVIEHADPKMMDEILTIKNSLQPIIAQALGAQGEDGCRVDSGYLRSPGFAPQVCHKDFKADEETNLPGGIFLGICPLTETGCYLQVWPPVNDTNRTQYGQVLFVPHGCILILPGDTIHGGGFLSDYETSDLRLHFYIYINGATPMEQNNQYFDPVHYPNHEGLKAGGALHKLFTSNENNCVATKRKR